MLRAGATVISRRAHLLASLLAPLSCQQAAAGAETAALAPTASAFCGISNAAGSRQAADLSSSSGGSQRAYATAGEEIKSSSSKGPVYLVFGATGGIGSALVRRLAGSQTAASLVMSAEDEAKLKDLRSQLSAQGSIDVMAADALDPDAVERVVQQVLQHHGRLDGVVNCVGNVVAASTLATDLDKLQDTLKVNLYSSFNIVKSSVKAMVGTDGGAARTSNSSSSLDDSAARKSHQNGGSIVLVSAALASHGIPNYEAMSAAKAAVEGLARSASATYAAHNIRVNCVAPGLTRTAQTRKFTDNPNVSKASEQMHPLKELATPDKVASALHFLLKPDNDFITGQVLAVDGGLSTLHPHHAEEYGV